jgi:hypothetical protein
LIGRADRRGGDEQARSLRGVTVSTVQIGTASMVSIPKESTTTLMPVILKDPLALARLAS